MEGNQLGQHLSDSLWITEPDVNTFHSGRGDGREEILDVHADDDFLVYMGFRVRDYGPSLFKTGGRRVDGNIYQNTRQDLPLYALEEIPGGRDSPSAPVALGYKELAIVLFLCSRDPEKDLTLHLEKVSKVFCIEEKGEPSFAHHLRIGNQEGEASLVKVPVGGNELPDRCLVCCEGGVFAEEFGIFPISQAQPGISRKEIDELRLDPCSPVDFYQVGNESFGCAVHGVLLQSFRLRDALRDLRSRTPFEQESGLAFPAVAEFTDTGLKIWMVEPPR